MSESKKNLTREEKLQRDLERIGQLLLIDDDFMNVCFDGYIEGAQLLLRIILNNSNFDQVMTSATCRKHS